MNKAISTFIWAGKSPRVKFFTLQRAKGDGGLALPNLLSYYWAANVQKIHTWHNYPMTDWCRMEALSCGSTSLSTLIFAPLNSYPADFTSNRIVQSTVKIWKQFRRHFKIRAMSHLMPISSHLFLPSSLDRAFLVWMEKGLVSLDQLYSRGVFTSFEALKRKFDLPQSHLFRFFQIRDFVRDNFPNFPRQPPDSLADEVLSF